MARNASIGIGLAGCGRIGRDVFLHGLGSMSGVRVTAIADPDEAALGNASRLAPRAAIVSDWRELPGRSDVEAVVVALPTSLHAEAALAVLGAGKALYLEKPLATTADEGRRVLAAQRSAPVVTMIGFNYRFNPLVAALKTDLDAGRVGTPRLVRSVFTTRSAPDGSWRAPSCPGGGVLLDLASHHFDLVQYLLDDPICRVAAQVRVLDRGAEVATVQLETRSGVLVESSFATGTVDDDRIEVTGEQGSAGVDRYRSTTVGRRPPAVPGLLARVAEAGRAVRGAPHVWRKAKSPWHEPSYTRVIERFVDAVARGAPTSPDLTDGWRALAVVLAAKEAALTGRRVDVEPEIPGGRNHA